MPTFFNKKDDDTWFELTRRLYENKETKEWIVTSFADRYNVEKEKVNYDIAYKNDGRFYVDIGVKIPKNIQMQIPKQD
jgi:hypothetical protein